MFKLGLGAFDVAFVGGVDVSVPLPLAFVVAFYAVGFKKGSVLGCRNEGIRYEYSIIQYVRVIFYTKKGNTCAFSASLGEQSMT